MYMFGFISISAYLYCSLDLFCSNTKKETNKTYMSLAISQSKSMGKTRKMTHTDLTQEEKAMKSGYPLVKTGALE